MPFTEDTKTIIQYLINNYRSLLVVDSKVKKSDKYLLDILDKIHASSEEIKNIRERGLIKTVGFIKRNVLGNPSPTSYIHRSFLKSKYVPRNIINILKNMTGNVVFETELNNKRVKIIFHTNGDTKLHKYEKLAYRMFVIFNLMSKNQDNKCSKTLTINILMTPLKKELPANKVSILGCDNANSAVTYRCSEKGNMFIFRSEELMKVFIHESMHSLGLDWGMDYNKKMQINIENLYNIKGNFNINEAYVEFWANILNCCFISYDLNKFDRSKYIIYSKQCIKFEKTFSLHQMNKVLSFMGISYDSLPGFRNYKENTNIFSYYILKTVLLYNYDDFIDLCATNNTNLIKWQTTKSNSARFCKFIKKYFRTREFLKDVKKVNEIAHTSGGFMGKTMRLTALELN
jgi:hypothetical protein